MDKQLTLTCACAHKCDRSLRAVREADNVRLVLHVNERDIVEVVAAAQLAARIAATGDAAFFPFHVYQEGSACAGMGTILLGCDQRAELAAWAAPAAQSRPMAETGGFWRQKALELQEEIARLRDELAVRNNSRGSTHWEGCYSHSPRHWLCAMAEVERQTRRAATAEAECARLRSRAPEREWQQP